jgi:hypothetical protein
MFTDRAAFRNLNRLESVYTVATSDGWLFPEGQLYSSRPSDADILILYESGLRASLTRLVDMIQRDSMLSRSRAVRVFQINPVSIENEAASFIKTIAKDPGSTKKGDRFLLLSGELAYLLHERIVSELASRGKTEIAVLPPKVDWAVGQIARELENRLPASKQLIVGAEASGGKTLTIQARIDRAAIVEGRSNTVAVQQLAASQVSAVVVQTDSSGQDITLPSSFAAKERKVMARGAGRYLLVKGIDHPPVRGMWMEGYIDALDKLVPDLVERMIRASEEIR